MTLWSPPISDASTCSTDSASCRARRRFAFVVTILVVSALIAYAGNRRVPTRGAEGIQFSAPWPAGLRIPQTLKVATYNIQGGVGLDDHYDLNRTARVLQQGGYDLIGLEEVHGYFFGPPANQAQELGETLHLPWLYAPSEQRWFHDDFGNAVISLTKINQWLRLPLPGTQSRGHRNVVILSVPMADRIVTVLITHLDREVDGPAQIASISLLFQSLKEPALLMGDLNRRPDDPAVHRLATAPGVEDCLARFPLAMSDTRVDWILTRGLTALHAGLDPANGTSDHPIVWAELALPPAQSPRQPATAPASTENR
jgi:endonuclease/exonuclease/phosphatase family metal-dependent hydrolase